MAIGASNLLVGSWALWSIAIFTVFCRMASRRILFGTFRKFQLDDYLMILCVLTFTGIVVSSNEVAIKGSNYAADSEIAGWTTQQKADAVVGSKLLIVLEECMLVTVWLVKACLLILYARLTAGLTESYAVRAVSVYCAVSFIVIQILYLGIWCKPFDTYWAVPVPSNKEQCKSYRHHMITTAAFHVSSDLMMLLIPVPLIARMKLPLRRKVVLCCVFGLGLAVVVVAILNRYYNFTETNSYIFLIWYNGEASTAIMIANIPFCWTLLRTIFSLDAWAASRKRSQTGSSGGFGGILGITSNDRSTRRQSNRFSLHGMVLSESLERITDGKDSGLGLHELSKIKATMLTEDTRLERDIDGKIR